MKILFDLDGTLCDPREGILHGFRHAMDTLGLPAPAEAAMVASIGLPLRNCFESFGLARPQAEEAAHHFQAFFEGRGFAEAKLYPGVLELLGKLRGRGIPLAIVSAKPAFAVRFVAESLGILPYFEGLYGCEPQELAPTKAPILAQALRELGWRPDECLLVGDRHQDREAAAAHGVPFIAAAWGFGAPEEHAGAIAVSGDVPQLKRFLWTRLEAASHA